MVKNVKQLLYQTTSYFSRIILTVKINRIYRDCKTISKDNIKVNLIYLFLVLNLRRLCGINQPFSNIYSDGPLLKNKIFYGALKHGCMFIL